MEWFYVLFLGVLACFTRPSEGGALPCIPGSQDLQCASDSENAPPMLLVKEALEKETATNDGECLSGSEWDSNCYACKCSGGRSSCVKKPDCTLDIAVEPIRCKPNTTFPRGCSICTCLENGLGLCTLDDCQKSTPPPRKPVQGVDCLPGSHWKNQCNDCGCSPNGMSFCTEKACPGQELHERITCAEDTAWVNDCNECWCANGRATCTKIGCISFEPPMFNSSETRNVADSEEKSEYSDGSREEYDQNTNVHIKHELDYNDKTIDQIEKADHKNEESDRSLITEQKLNEHDDNLLEEKNHFSNTHTVLKRSVCKPNQDFQSECNACKCAADGQSYTCTRNECMEGEKNKEVEVFMESEGNDHIERHSVCKPRVTFYIGCNTCHCNYDGTDYSCTNKPCPLPEDVELFHELKEMKPIIPYVDEDGSNRNSTQKFEKAPRI